MREELRQETGQCIGVVHRRASDLDAVLNQHGEFGVLEDDVVGRVPLSSLRCDLEGEIVIGILGLPIAERHAQRVQQRAVDINAITSRGNDVVFRDEGQIEAPPPALEEVLERLAQHAFAA